MAGLVPTTIGTFRLPGYNARFDRYIGHTSLLPSLVNVDQSRTCKILITGKGVLLAVRVGLGRVISKEPHLFKLNYAMDNAIAARANRRYTYAHLIT